MLFCQVTLNCLRYSVNLWFFLSIQYLFCCKYQEISLVIFHKYFCALMYRYVSISCLFCIILECCCVFFFVFLWCHVDIINDYYALAVVSMYSEFWRQTLRPSYQTSSQLTVFQLSPLNCKWDVLLRLLDQYRYCCCTFSCRTTTFHLPRCHGCSRWTLKWYA